MKMERWVRARSSQRWRRRSPAGLPAAHAGQLPDDVNPESRSRLPPIDREELDPTRREAFDAAVASPAGAPTGRRRSGCTARAPACVSRPRWGAG